MYYEGAFVNDTMTDSSGGAVIEAEKFTIKVRFGCVCVCV